MAKEKLLLPPLLLTTNGEDSDDESFYNLSENRYRTTSIPVLRDKVVVCSAYGWLVLLEYTEDVSISGECCLWNPTSLEIIQLPDLEYPGNYNRCFLSRPPTDPDCLIIFTSIRCFDIVVYRLQDNAMFRINVARQGYFLMSMVSLQGIIYGVIEPFGESKYEFVTVHLVGDNIEIQPLLIGDKLPWEVPQGVRSWNIWNHVYLMELSSSCGNELLLVTKMLFNDNLDSATHFRIFRVDVGRMECEELDNLDGRTIFIGYYGNGFCCSSESSGATIKPNSIYYTLRNGDAMYVYDLDDRSMTTLFLPHLDSDIDSYTKEHFWVDLTSIP